MRTIIAGSRGFDDFETMDLTLKQLPFEITVVISGGAKGADALAERWAREHGIPVEQHPADWDLHGKRAGYLRNVEMAQVAEACVVFWDGASKGSKHMINIAWDYFLDPVVIHYTDRYSTKPAYEKRHDRLDSGPRF
jgi:hypothetical protein